jgi:predicted homoserine dehydrogenase-like protein
MALLANGLGLRTHVPGMLGPRASHVREVFERFDLAALWRDRQPCVDYLLGAEPGGGVYAIGFCEEPYQREMLAYYKLGDGPFYLFYRPYHLCHVEAMLCVAEAALERRALLEPRYGFRTNVLAYAKKPLRVGEELDGIGGYACYGLIENVADDAPRPGLPICLAEGLRVRRAIDKGERIALADVDYDAGRLDFELHAKAVAAARAPT